MFGFLGMGCRLWRENGSVIYSYNCYWTFPALPFLGPSPAGLVTMSYCLIWDWVPFVASYDSQGYEFQLLATANAARSSLIFFPLIMEVLGSSGTSVLIRATRSHISGDGILHSHRSKNPQTLHSKHIRSSLRCNRPRLKVYYLRYLHVSNMLYLMYQISNIIF
jgi:hypothetical protein